MIFRLHLGTLITWGFPEMGGSQKWWFNMENPIWKWMIWEYPHFRNRPQLATSIHLSLCLKSPNPLKFVIWGRRMSPCVPSPNVCQGDIPISSGECWRLQDVITHCRWLNHAINRCFSASSPGERPRVRAFFHIVRFQQAGQHSDEGSLPGQDGIPGQTWIDLDQDLQWSWFDQWIKVRQGKPIIQFQWEFT